MLWSESPARELEHEVCAKESAWVSLCLPQTPNPQGTPTCLPQPLVLSYSWVSSVAAQGWFLFSALSHLGDLSVPPRWAFRQFKQLVLQLKFPLPQTSECSPLSFWS